jgi:hypothetical protein
MPAAHDRADLGDVALARTVSLATTQRSEIADLDFN